MKNEECVREPMRCVPKVLRVINFILLRKFNAITISLSNKSE